MGCGGWMALRLSLWHRSAVRDQHSRWWRASRPSSAWYLRLSGAPDARALPCAGHADGGGWFRNSHQCRAIPQWRWRLHRICGQGGLLHAKAMAGTDGRSLFPLLHACVASLGFLLIHLHERGKPGRAWSLIRRSEAAAMAVGIDVTFYKIWGFALSGFLAGVAGGLLGRQSSASRCAFIPPGRIGDDLRTHNSGRRLELVWCGDRRGALSLRAGAAQRRRRQRRCGLSSSSVQP
jgi:hypothetical protein